MDVTTGTATTTFGVQLKTGRWSKNKNFHSIHFCWFENPAGRDMGLHSMRGEANPAVS